MNQMKSHKIQSILTFIYIFLIPFTAVLYHCLLTTPAFQKHFPMETVQPYLSFFFNLLMVLCLLSFISIIITTCNNTQKQIELNMLDSTQQTILKQEKEIETLRTQILEKQSYIHSHIDLAIDLCESGNYDDMTTLISSLSSHVKRNYPDTYCKNALLNTLLQEKKAIADQLNVKCEFRILLPDHFDQTFSDFTITSIFSNLLDNALESCKNCHDLYPQNDSLFIELSTDFKANMFMIRMKNSKDPKDIFLNKTTKDDSSSLHGHGLSIIESIARDYDGTCQWSDDGDCFVSLIMLKHT